MSSPVSIEVFDWAVIWGERRKAAAASSGTAGQRPRLQRWWARPQTSTRSSGSCATGAPDGANRSDMFHTVVGHYLGCGWSVEQILAHLRQFPDGIAGRYLA